MAETIESPLLNGLRITFSQVRGFVTVASAGNFTRAADALHLSQPALTTRIRQLEEALDLRLFDRTARSVVLTEPGRELLPVFLRLVNELETAVVNAKDHAEKAHSTIKLACLPSCAATLLPDLIRSFKVDRPDAVFVLEDALNTQICDLVRQGKVDFGICVGEAEDPELACEPLLDDDLQVVYGEGHALHSVEHVTVEELARHPLILTNKTSSIRALIESAFASHGLTAAPAYEANYMSTAVALVRAGLGVAILPSTAVELQTPGVGARRVDDAAFTRSVMLVRRRGVPLRKTAEAFAQHVAANLRRAN